MCTLREWRMVEFRLIWLVLLGGLIWLFKGWVIPALVRNMERHRQNTKRRTPRDE